MWCFALNMLELMAQFLLKQYLLMSVSDNVICTWDQI